MLYPTELRGRGTNCTRFAGTGPLARGRPVIGTRRCQRPEIMSNLFTNRPASSSRQAQNPLKRKEATASGTLIAHNNHE